jgi:hypothetical protein
VWVIRELLRLLEKIVVAVLVAILIAEVRTLIAGGDRLHAFQISLLAIGAGLIALGAMSPNSAYDRYASARTRYWNRRIGLDTHDEAPPGGRTLTPVAVFVASGAIVIVLGFVV